MSENHLAPLLAYIEFCYPDSFQQIKKENLISPNLFSPFVLEIPQKINEQVEKLVASVYRIKETDEYQNRISPPSDFQSWPKTKSILTCFDFHYTEEQGLKLIEINTNASLYLPITLQRCAQANNCQPPQFADLFRSFEEAFDLKPGDKISVFDKVPENEGLYFEFLIFKEWLMQKGFETNIVSLESFEQEAHDNVYNRYTDFYFTDPESTEIKDNYFNHRRKFSPNPREYFLMADKKRLQVLREFLQEENPVLANIIPETRTFAEFESKDALWETRKKYFFKPGISFGSKGAFSGKGISRKAFDRLFAPDFIAQEFCPAGRQTFEHGDEKIEMKFDLRFFTFNGKVQNYGARLYQGQTTNMKTPLGGLTPIQFI